MEKIWAQHYTNGVPSEINVDEFKSVLDVFEKAFVKFKTLPAFANMGRMLSYHEVDYLSRDFAAYLQKVCGLKKGDRIAIQMPNLLQYPVVMMGALRAGLIVVNTNPLYTQREMEHQFNDSGAKAIVILANFAHNLAAIIQNTKIEHVVVTEIGDMMPFPKRLIVNSVVKYVKKMVPAFHLPKAKSYNEALKLGSDLKFDPVDIGPEDVAFLQYTGGTTGVSKGAMLTNRNLVANMQQISGVMVPLIREKEEVVVTALPLYHIFCLTVNCMAFMKVGALSILITNPKDIKAYVKEISQYKFTVMTGVNTLYNALLHNAEFVKLDFSKLKVAVGGGMAVQQAVSDKWKSVTGSHIVEGYGLTESSPLLTVNPIDGSGKVGTIGIPAPSTLVKIVKEDGTEAPVGEPGEVWGKGPQIMKGYWQRPEETAKVITSDGWLKTGDIGIMLPDGYFKIVDRIKDMILVSGFNVYPNEIEDVVAKHPGVLEVAAIGIPDEKSGEAVKIVVVKKDPNLSKEDLIKHCRENLTGYKIPRHVEFRTDLPKSNVGKILRRELRT